jgi:starch synthase
VVGFAKTGGLADVAGALPPALARRGHDCAVLLPLYHCARLGRIPLQPTEHVLRVPVAGRTVEGRLWRGVLPGSDVPAYLVEQRELFDRDDPTLGRGLYQFLRTNGSRGDYPDNDARFIFFCRAVLEAIRLLDFWPDVLHANDWQTGLVPVYLREEYARYPNPALRSRYHKVRTLYTVHNIAYQGAFWSGTIVTAGLDWRLYNPGQLECYGHVNFLKAGLVFSDYVNTVSPTYAREIQTPYYGCGLQGVLSARRDRLFGIVNGVDYRVWDPATDPHLAAHYSAEDLFGKAVCKAALQKRCGLPEDASVPVLGVVARLVEQKGIDLVGRAGPGYLQRGCQLVVLGDGDPGYHAMLENLRNQFPDRVSLTFGFNEALAHQIEAGADLFLMPSLYEPSGLNQLYSMRYGTPPVVRATGGLADTVVDATPANLGADTATGFSFQAYTPDAFLDAILRGLSLYRGPAEPWRRLVRTAMRQDWSWDRSAAEYEKLYSKMKEDRG